MTVAISVQLSYNSVLQPLHIIQLPLLKGKDMKFNCQTHSVSTVSAYLPVSLHLETCLVNAQVPRTGTGMGTG